MPASPLPALWSSDALVLLSLLLLTLFSLKLLPVREIYDLVNPRPSSSESSTPFSVHHAVASYSQYHRLSTQELGRMRSSYTRLLTRQQKRIAYDMGYTKKLNRYAEVIDLNAQFMTKVCSFVETLYGIPPSPSSSAGDLTRVRESLRHLVRDWSAEGTHERQTTFAPILSALSLPRGSSVLVPGAGLSRLAYELARRGYAVTACELSAYQNLLFKLMCECDREGQYEICPYAHWWSHSRATADLFRSVKVPDVVPRLSSLSFSLVEGDFLGLPSEPTYDAIVTLFFIDTSTNLLSTLARIHALLKPGGTWINLGPLLWTPGQQAAMECSLDEVIWAAESAGFDFSVQAGGAKTRTVECEYTADPRAMMRWVYRAEFWLARKV
ncbi:N2227-domain-containing protein [Neolentinus lepideus HHB14362 ss-1]|uniref:N2227-domain-containing protein n=1 Tax=Neolentinus lepideus HHB14362 ss-1 TaxID=1314782 RepID=A0A165QJ54_9AGAM|nr:N2227-domain-containing protein [Neolentinus lepideus HHB14362 ss-1]